MEGMFVIHCFLIKWGWGSSAEKVIQHAFVMYTCIIDLCLHQDKERMSFKYTFIYLHKVVFFFFFFIIAISGMFILVLLGTTGKL